MRQTKIAGWCLCFGLCLVMHATADITLYVVPPGTAVTPADPYASWDTAATNIQTAINAAGANAGYNTIVVSSGVYNLTGQLTIAKGMLVRSWKDGALDRTNTKIVAASGFRCVELNHADAVLCGFTLTNGSRTIQGAGVCINANGGTVSNCIITGNIAQHSGGGVCQFAGLVADCVISGNIAHITGNIKGAGIYALGGQIMDSQIINNFATNDAAAGYGSGVYVGGPYTITRCVIAGNTNACPGGGSGGGLYVQGSASLSVSNTVIRDNYAHDTGGGVNLRDVRNAEFHNCDISGNTTPARGGGIYTDNRNYISNCLFANCTITGNYARSQGGGIYINTGTNLIAFQNCLIAGNKTVSGAYGGGIYMASSVSSIDNCTIVGNSAITAGGGIYAPNAITNPINNCIIYHNTAGASNDIALVDSASANCFFYSCAGSIVLPPGQGNHANDPGFVGADDFHLSVNSPCVNAGNNAPWMADAVDLDGNARIDRFSQRVDMGCYEYLPCGVLYRIK